MSDDTASLLADLTYRLNQIAHATTDYDHRQHLWRTKCALVSALIVALPDQVLAVQDSEHPDLVSIRVGQIRLAHCPLHFLDAEARKRVVMLPV